MSTYSSPPSRWRQRALAVTGALILGVTTLVSTTASAGDIADPPPGFADPNDPRSNLAPGLYDAEEAASNVELLSTTPKAGGLANGINSDLAFFDDFAVSGNYNGFQIYDISDPAAPTPRTQVVCPGSQNDVSVFGNLMFMSVESTAGRVDCSNNPIGPVFRGIRVFDISNLDNPVQVAAVQTCRGSHTHTVVEDPNDPANIYIYNSGTAGVRNATELEGCTNTPSGNNPDSFIDEDGNPIYTSRFQVEVIKVPLAAPQDSAIVQQARLFQDYETGNQVGLQWQPPAPQHPSGGSWSPAPITDACHDITAYPEIGLAAGACEGNGILIDISDPANPVRLDEVSDPNFAYWHSATFSNDGSTIVFTDEWGGGGGARCRDTDRLEWGANAIFDVTENQMEFASYYKLPAVQSTTENCVAHNGSLIPVPGRDVMVQAWYQGGLSIFDFTDSANPVEIGYFDRGPVNGEQLAIGGYWSVYFNNGYLYGNEMARGFDTLDLVPSEYLSANEIAAAKEFTLPEFNAQAQPRIDHAPSYAVAGSYVDQAERAETLTGATLAQIREKLAYAESLGDDPARAAEVKATLTEAAALAAPDPAAQAAIQALADTIEVDTQRPTVNLVSPTSAGPLRSLAIQVDAADNQGLSRIVANIYQGSTLVRSTQTRLEGENSASHTAEVTLPDGTYTIRYNAHDSAGNVSTTQNFTVTIDATAPTATVKEGSSYTIGSNGVYEQVSYKLYDAGKIDKVELNGVTKDLSNNTWSDVNYIKPGVFGAVAGENTLVVYDVAGNTRTITFTLTG